MYKNKIIEMGERAKQIISDKVFEIIISFLLAVIIMIAGYILNDVSHIRDQQTSMQLKADSSYNSLNDKVGRIKTVLNYMDLQPWQRELLNSSSRSAITIPHNNTR